MTPPFAFFVEKCTPAGKKDSTAGSSSSDQHELYKKFNEELTHVLFDTNQMYFHIFWDFNKILKF